MKFDVTPNIRAAVHRVVGGASKLGKEHLEHVEGIRQYQTVESKEIPFSALKTVSKLHLLLFPTRSGGDVAENGRISSLLKGTRMSEKKKTTTYVRHDTMNLLIWAYYIGFILYVFACAAHSSHVSIIRIRFHLVSLAVILCVHVSFRLQDPRVREDARADAREAGPPRVPQHGQDAAATPARDEGYVLQLFASDEGLVRGHERDSRHVHWLHGVLLRRKDELPQQPRLRGRLRRLGPYCCDVAGNVYYSAT